MEFRRLEIKKVVRYSEVVTEQDDVREIFESIYKNNLAFSLKTSTVNLQDCSIVNIGETCVEISSRKPLKVKLKSKYNEIELVEVFCNRSINASNDSDDGGRWSRLI